MFYRDCAQPFNDQILYFGHPSSTAFTDLYSSRVVSNGLRNTDYWGFPNGYGYDASGNQASVNVCSGGDLYPIEKLRYSLEW